MPNFGSKFTSASKFTSRTIEPFRIGNPTRRELFTFGRKRTDLERLAPQIEPAADANAPRERDGLWRRLVNRFGDR
jgi:hypothetical protein